MTCSGCAQRRAIVAQSQADNGVVKGTIKALPTIARHAVEQAKPFLARHVIKRVKK